MSSAYEHTQSVMAFAVDHLTEDVGLDALARCASLSSFHLHRVFSGVAGETPRAYTARLRLERAAALLLTTDDTVLRVALACGFQSHEGFTRAFRARFEMSPSAYRARGFARAVTPTEAAAHRACVDAVGPCLGLYHLPDPSTTRSHWMDYTITTTTAKAQPVLLRSFHVSPAEISKAIGEGLGSVFAYAQQHGLALTGRPFARYPEMSHGMMTIEPGMFLGSAAPPPSADDSVRLDTLPGGTHATTIHAGPYENLREAYAALQAWMTEQGLAPAGAPWEIYITDPMETPDTADWRTQVCWPVE